MVTPTHKLVVDVRDEVVLLANLEHDPYELENLAGVKAHAELEYALTERLSDFRRATNDSFPAAPDAALASYPDVSL